MKITYNWLKEFVDFGYSPQVLAEHLTMLGLEVELVVPVKPSFSGVVVGKILEIIPHPNAEKLLVCKVTTGKGPATIICGAHNIQAGDLVPVAAAGALLAHGASIGKRTIRGIHSAGMLCSEQELGLTDKGEGIFILSKDNLKGKTPQIGKPLEDALSLKDAILDISITANRADALSVIGIAREISALTKNPLRIPEVTFPQKGEPTQRLAAVKVKNKRLCPRYTARIITGVEIKQSPFWLRYRLMLAGMRAINNIVDITNYVLLECGQPLHAFDYRLMSGNTVIIRTARPGEKIVTIDNETRALDKNILVIADKEKPVAVAGVIGGKDAEVGPGTRDILLESALFNPVNVRRTAKRFGITTESSYRFERGIDPKLPPRASDRAVQLILALAGGRASRGLIDCAADIPKAPVIGFSPSFCNRVLGTKIPPGKMSSILNALGCKVSRMTKKQGSLRVKPPGYRTDLTREIDLAEEVARLYGYPRIPFAMPSAEVVPDTKEKIYQLTITLQGLLTGLGLNEIITYSFISPDDLYRLRLPRENRPSRYISLLNPVSRQTTIMRTTLIPGIIKTIQLNLNKGNSSLSIFETGKCFFPRPENTFPEEDARLAIGLTGTIQPAHWKGKSKEIDFFSLKGILEELMNRLSIYKYQFPAAGNPMLHPGRACNIKVNNKEIGTFGELHPAVARNYDISQRVYIAEIRIAPLAPARELPPRFRHLPKYPGIRRDISIIVDNSTTSYDIIKIVREADIELIESVELFDLYKGHPVPFGKKSLAYAIIYRHSERTLTDKEVDNIHKILRQKILETVPEVQIRE